jgi:hypothetical protein
MQAWFNRPLGVAILTGAEGTVRHETRIGVPSAALAADCRNRRLDQCFRAQKGSGAEVETFLPVSIQPE